MTSSVGDSVARATSRGDAGLTDWCNRDAVVLVVPGDMAVWTDIRAPSATIHPAVPGSEHRSNGDDARARHARAARRARGAA